MLIGIPIENPFVIDIFGAMNKELRILTLKRSNHKGAAAARLIAAGLVPDGLVTHVLPFEQTARGFEVLANYSENVGKVIIEVAK